MVYMLSTISIFANENRNITWESLGIGIHNKGEITDWTYYGIKTPEEASLWIEALKPLGGISYAGAARLWKQNGYSADEVREWVRIGVKTPEEVSRWKRTEIKDAQELKLWRELGVSTSQELSQWIQAGIFSPDVAKQCIEKSTNEPFACANSIYPPKRVESNVVKEKAETALSSKSNRVIQTVSENKENSVYSNAIETVSATESSPYSTGTGATFDVWQFFLLTYFIIMIITIFKGAGENRTVVIFRDYNDLGLTFLIPASFVLIFYLFAMVGGNPTLGMGLALVVSLVLFAMLTKSTYEDNHRALVPTILSIMTKIPLGIIWIVSFITMLNPGGKTAAERRKNRGTALIIMGILTPIIGMLIVNKEGSLFNPRDWIKGRRIGSIRKHL